MIKSLAALPVAALACALVASWPGPVQAQDKAGADWIEQVQPLATQAARAAFGGRPDMRAEVAVGALDPRLKLAPCAQVQVYLPPGQRAWGRTRVGLRCVQGAVAWNVYLPLTVRLYAPALVAVQPLAAGTLLQAEHLRLAEADWAAAESPVVRSPAAAVGRTLMHGLTAGATLREADLKKRIWFSAGDPVRVLATGPGFAVGGDAVALSAGLEGQPVRVRTDGGRTLTGVATGERRVELSL